jgi:outer membrane receptor for ferrienterochelin and colicins
VFFKFLIALQIFILGAGFISAQGLEVHLKDEQGKPMFGAHVMVTTLAGDAKTKVDITNTQGFVRFDLQGPFVVKVSHMGYHSFIDTVPHQGVLRRQLQLNPYQLSDFQVTGQATPVRLEESVYKVRIIDQQRIQAQGAQNLRDLLSQDLNIRVTQDAILGAGMSMQGVGGENVKIMIDGVPVIGRLDGNIDLAQINLNQIAKVEIVEGPMSVQFGTNALGGVINLITKKEQPHAVEGRIGTYYESVGQYNLDAGVGLQFKKTLIQVSGGRYFFSGISPNDSVPSRARTWKPREQYMADLSISHRFGGLQGRYQGSFYRDLIQNKGRPEAPFFISANDQYFETLRHNHAVFLQGFLRKHHHLDITASYGHFRRTRESIRKDLVTLEETPIGQNVDEFQLWLNRSVYTYMPDSSKWQVQAGYEFNAETGSGPRITDGFQHMIDAAGFAAITYKPHPKLTLKPGIRYGWNSRFTPVPAPSFHLKYGFAKNWDIRASYARGFRAPSLKELFFEFVDINHRIFGNPELTSESSHNAQFQLSYIQKIKTKHRLHFTLGGFFNDIDNQIRLVLTSITPDSIIYRNENISYFKSAGGRLQVQYEGPRLSMGAGMSYTGTENGLNTLAGQTNRMVFYPEYQANAALSFPKWRGKLTGFFKFTGTMPVLYTAIDPDTDTEMLMEGLIGSFANLDVSYSQSFFKNRLQVILIGKNLLNVTDIRQTAPSGGAHSSGSATLPTLWGRSLGVTLRYNFQIGS